MKPFDYDYLKFWFKSKNHLFKMFHEYQLGKKKKHRRLFFDNGGKVLLVAHIDTVQEPRIHYISRKTIHAQGLDDRLGCAIGYWIMQYLPVDLLICDYEESGRSTAQYHDLKDYNFIIELDRGGTDFVDYHGLAEMDMIDDIETSSGMNCGWGSFSDICLMETTIGAVNWGIGYHNDHAKNSYASKKDIQKQVRRLWEFIETFQNHPYKEGVQVLQHTNMGLGYWTSTDYDRPYLYDGEWYDAVTGESDNDGDKESCDYCGAMFGKAMLINHTCVDCRNSFHTVDEQYEQSLISEAGCPRCGECEGDCDCDDYETYNIMLDGNVHEVRMKNENIT